MSACGTWYAVNRALGGMHRFIMRAERGTLVDHRDGDGLNNLRHNLRVATRRENARNRRGKTRGAASSKYLGVSFNKKLGKWRAVIQAGALLDDNTCSHITIGHFSDERLAASAFDAAAALCFGEFARLNFPDENQDIELLKRRIIGEIEALSSGRFSLISGGRRIGIFASLDEAHAARAALPINSDESRLRQFHAYLTSERLATFNRIRSRI